MRIAAEYERNFAGMTEEDVPPAELHAARAQLVEVPLVLNFDSVLQ
jgi:hypothetical protein